MGKYSNFDETNKQLQQVLKAFYKKYGIETKDNNDRNYDLIMNRMIEFNQMIKFVMSEEEKKKPNEKAKKKEDEKENELEENKSLENKEYDKYIFDLKSYFNSILKELIEAKTKSYMDVANEADYKENENDKYFLSDFSSIMSQIVKDSYYNKLSTAGKEQLKTEGREDFFFKPDENTYKNVKIFANAATDKKLVAIKGNTYNNNNLLMSRLNTSIAVSKTPVNRNVLNRLDVVRNNASDMITDYLVLKEQYNKRGNFTKWFLSFGTKRALKNAEKEMDRLASMGAISLARDKGGNIDYTATALNYVPESTIQNEINHSAITNNCKHTTFYEDNMNKTDMEIEHDEKFRNNVMLEAYVKDIKLLLENPEEYKSKREIQVNYFQLNDNDKNLYNQAIQKIKEEYEFEAKNKVKGASNDFKAAVKKAMKDAVEKAPNDAKKIEEDYSAFRKKYNDVFNGFEKNRNFKELKQGMNDLKKSLEAKNINIDIKIYQKFDEIEKQATTKNNKLINNAPLAQENKQEILLNNLSNEFDEKQVNNIENLNIDNNIKINVIEQEALGKDN